VKSVPAWVTYSALRLLLIAVPLAILLILQVNWVIATIASVLIGLCLSYIFLRRRREATSTELYAISQRKRTPVTIDDDIEDAAIDEAERRAARPRKPVIEDDDAAEPALSEQRQPERGTQGGAVRQPDDPGQLQG
jgi:uncharacterized membrane protein YraQ (UPF0718 family)